MRTKKRKVRKNEKVVFTRIYKKDLKCIERLIPDKDNTDRIRILYNHSLVRVENELRKMVGMEHIFLKKKDEKKKKTK